MAASLGARLDAVAQVPWTVVILAELSTDPTAGVGILAALAAGIVSFLSPCVLPLVPGYLSAVSGVSAAELDSAGWRRVLGPSLLFVASFSAIFIVLGLTATGLGSTLQDHKQLLTKISAALIIAMGVLFVASLFVTRLNREWHVDGLLERAGKGGPIVAGAAFAIAWTPCIGPTLGAILSAASLSGSAAHGALLLAVYSAGLAIPFILTALAFSRMTTAFAVVKRHYQAIVATGGVILIAMGILIWTGELTQLNIEAQRLLSESRPRLLERGLRTRLAGASLRPRSVGSGHARKCASLTALPCVLDLLGQSRPQGRLFFGATVTCSWPIASVSSSPASSSSCEQTMRKRPVPISESGTTGRPRISSQPSRSTSNGFIRTSAAGNGQLRLCWSIALEIASRFFASGDATAGF